MTDVIEIKKKGKSTKFKANHNTIHKNKQKQKQVTHKAFQKKITQSQKIKQKEEF